MPVHCLDERSRVGGNRAWDSCGLMWMILTIIFEFALDRLVVGDSWSKLLGDYNLLEGRVFSLFILWVALAPYVFYRIRG